MMVAKARQRATWKLDPDRDFTKLLEYEWRLEEFLRENPNLGEGLAISR